MNVWSIIIAAAIFILPSLLPSKKKAGKKTVVSTPKTTVEQTLEEFFGMDKMEETVSHETETFDDDFDFEDDRDGAFAEDDLGQPVFSYETISKKEEESHPHTAAVVEESEVAFQEDATDSKSVTTLGEGFDLRKAIIYQTIMQRVSA